MELSEKLIRFNQLNYTTTRCVSFKWCETCVMPTLHRCVEISRHFNHDRHECFSQRHKIIRHRQVIEQIAQLEREKKELEKKINEKSNVRHM